MPALSPTMVTGSVSSWRLAEGDAFGAGDALCAIETDKASVDFEAQDDGVLAKILVIPGVDVTIGTPICVVTDDAADVAAFADYAVAAAVPATPPAAAAVPAKSAEAAPPAAAATPSTAPAATATARPSSSAPSILLPSARHLAESRGKDATGLAGSAKGGRVTKADVLAALHANRLPDLVSRGTTRAAANVAHPPAAAPAPVAAPAPSTAAAAASYVDLPVPEPSGQTTYEDVPNNKMRKIIASRLTASKRDVPHSYTSMEVALDSIMALRKQLLKNHDVKISVNDFVIRGCALALRDVPEVNGTYDIQTHTVRYNDTIDVSVAVATPTGLITPIVFGTDQLGLAQLTRTIQDLAGRARDGKLQPHEYQGGTFSVSNLGMFGSVSEFSAVINPPQAAILAVGGGTPTLLPAGKSVLYDENDDDVFAAGQRPKAKPVLQTIMTARLSADRRVVDEATASLFLQAFRHYMQTPELLLL